LDFAPDQLFQGLVVTHKWDRRRLLPRPNRRSERALAVRSHRHRRV